MSEFFNNILPYLPIAIIPIISGFVGWITNIIAIKMTFYPIEYVGIRPFGWQGIIPSKAKKMASISVDLMADKLIDIKEVFSRLDPLKIADIMKGGMSKLSSKIVEEIMQAQAPGVWKLMPKTYKNKIHQRINEKIPEITADIMRDIKEDIKDLLNLKALAITVLMNDKSLINRIFIDVAKEEFKFIEKSGFYFGFLFGIIQMIVFIYYRPWWILPLFGLLVGYFTNYLAIKLIFRPIKPIKILGINIQGIFHKRQKEVSSEYAKIVTGSVLTTANLFDFIMRGPDTSGITRIIDKHFKKLIYSIADSYKRLLKAIGGYEKLEIIKNIGVYRFKNELPLEISSIYPYAEKAIDLENTMKTKMTNLESKEFEGFLRPVFKEDEMKLILVGAFLGGIAGLAQYFIFFS